MKLTKGLITREDASKMSHEYVDFVEGSRKHSGKILEAFDSLRRGDHVLTFNDGQFVKAVISSVKHDDIRAIDGPVVRVSNGECSWRVDGDKYATPISKG